MTSTPPRPGAGLATRSVLLLALQVALQARALVQVPLLTRALTPEAFGALTLALWIAGAAGALSALGLQTGFYLHLVRIEGSRTRAAIASVLALALPVVGTLGLSVTLALAAGVAGLWLPSLDRLAVPLGLLVAATGLREVVMIVPRARQQVAVFVAGQLWMHYGGLALGLALLFTGRGVHGFLLGLAAGAWTGTAAVAVYVLRHADGPAAWDSAFAAKVVRGAGPVVPLALAHMSLLSLDYAFVSRSLGPAAVATYGLAYTFASPVLLAVAVNNFTLLPEYVARHRQGESTLATFVQRLLGTGWTAGLLIVAAAIVAGPAAVGLLAGAAYGDAGRLLPVIVASYVLFVLSQMLHIVRSAVVASVRATAAVAVTCAVLNLIANIWAVPAYGMEGAALTTLASFLLYYLALTAIVRPLVRVPADRLRPAVALVSLTLGATGALFATGPARGAIAAALAAVALAPLGTAHRNSWSQRATAE